MNLLRQFFAKKTPKCSGEPLPYFQQVIYIVDIMLCVYFFAVGLFLSAGTLRFFPMPLLMLTAVAIKRALQKFISPRVSILIYFLIICLWCSWYVTSFGWGYGGQNLLIIMVVLVFFSVYEPPWAKVCYFLTMLLVRMLLFVFSLVHTPLFILPQQYILLYQLVNSLTMFLILAACCIVFSSTIQETQRTLMLDNEQLHYQAETDPLTKLSNRRSMVHDMEQYIRENPESMFCVAMADIDLFKHVNDTYGHACGDYVLQRLAELFLEKAPGNYAVSRWGGEEFCFLLQGKNIDDAGAIISEVCIAAANMPLEYEDHHFNITLTAGVEEGDYRCSIEELIAGADRKLYMGKRRGRNRVVV